MNSGGVPGSLHGLEQRLEFGSRGRNPSNPRAQVTSGPVAGLVHHLFWRNNKNRKALIPQPESLPSELVISEDNKSQLHLHWSLFLKYLGILRKKKFG